MAKQQSKPTEQDGPAPPASLVELPGVQAPRPDPRDEQIARLKAQLEQLQRKQEQEKPAPAPQGPTRLWRVSLAEARPQRASVTVEPHDGRASQDQLKLKPASYDSLELFLAGGKDLQAEAWRRYREENALPDDKQTRKAFRVRVEALQSVDHLDLPAGSKADAEELFRGFAGVTRTEREFTTVLVEPEA